MILVLRHVIKLTRWHEFVPFTVPVTLLGGLMAYQYGGASLDWRLFAVLIANCLAVGYAFMINDIEDAEDDQHDATRAARNAVAMGEISKRASWLAALGVAVLAAVLYAAAGIEAFITGIVILILAHLYSWKPVRLKSLPLLDIISHVLFLAALLMIAPYWVYDSAPTTEVWMLIIAITLFSAYGQFYNQVRDFDADQAANLRNTAGLIGKPATQVLSYASIIIAVICLVIPIVQGAFPIWLLGVIALSLPIAYFAGRGRDMRGDEASDAIGEGQVQFLLVANITLIVWLISVLVG